MKLAWAWLAVWLVAMPAVAAEPEPGTRLSVDAASLPPLNATPSVAHPPVIVPRPEGIGLAVPPGYGISLFAADLGHPRNLLGLPDGGLLVADSRDGTLILLRGSGASQRRLTFAQGFDTPFGLALYENAVWVADLDAVWRLPWVAGQDRGGQRQRMTAPGALGEGGGHSTRSLAIAPDGEHFFVGIGSVTNLDVEAPPRATIEEFTIDGGGEHSFASGLRNPVGLAFRPGTDELWTVVNERDNQGDDMVPDYLTRVVENGFYGWPFAYLGPHPQPGFAEKEPSQVAATRIPDALFRAHSAPLGLAFWHGDAYVALHGSWNRSHPQGYFVARIPFAHGHPAKSYEVFASGFILGEEQGRARVWGRPVGLAVGADDALYVCDDEGGTVWRIVKQ